MLVYRWTWLVKNTRFQEALGLGKEASERFWKPKNVVYRLYSANIGPGNTVMFEMEAKDEAQYAEYWKQYNEKDANTPWAKDFWQKFNDAVERFISLERWNLVK
jgi:hypothetical protein